MTISRIQQLTEDLIRRPSVSPEDLGCQNLLAEYLEPLGFTIEHLRFGDVDNLWAVREGLSGPDAPLFAFAGHTDVVPAGPLSDWHSNPFEPEIRNGLLYGRGAADMKGSLAAMVIAIENFLANYSQHNRLALLITSDEEADAVNGTIKVMQTLQERGEQITWCVVGEPSSTDTVGDVVRVGRRGSLNAKLTVRGIQGHVAYPTEADNPIHAVMPALASLSQEHWDHGNNFFPATTMQISNIHGGTGANNVIPGECCADFNFRFSTESTVESLKERTEQLLNRFELDYILDWSLSGLPFLTAAGRLIDVVSSSIYSITGTTTDLSTSGGTSDGRFIAPTGTELVELGPCNATIHKINECTDLEQLNVLSSIYQKILIGLLSE